MTTKQFSYQGDTLELSRTHINLGFNKVAPKATYSLHRVRSVGGVTTRSPSFEGYSEERAFDYFEKRFNRPAARIIMASFDAPDETNYVRPPQPRPRITGLPRSMADAIANV